MGVRVPAEHFHAACTAILGAEEADRLSADRYFMKGVPLHWGKREVMAAAAKLQWECTVEPTPRYDWKARARTWFLRAKQPPMQGNLVQHEHGLLIVEKAKPGVREPGGRAKGRKPMYTWSAGNPGAKPKAARETTLNPPGHAPLGGQAVPTHAGLSAGKPALRRISAALQATVG